MRNLRIAMFVFVAVFCLSSAGWAATYYIDGGSGNDANAGTLTSPWKTIGKANSTLVAGDTVYLRKGTYKETIRPARSGSAGKYITYAEYNDENPTLTVSSSVAIDLTSRSYIKIDGINVTENTGSKGTALWVDMNNSSGQSSNYNIIENCTMQQTATRDSGVWAGIYVANGSHNQFLNNNFSGKSGNPKGDLLSIRPDSSYNLIQGNYFGETTHQAFNIQGNASDGTESVYNVVRNNTFNNPLHSNLSVWRFAGHTLIENNISYGAGSDKGSDIYAPSSYSNNAGKGLELGGPATIVRNNFFKGNVTESFQKTSKAQEDVVHSRVYSNTFYGNTNNILSNAGVEVSDLIFKNNISVNASSSNIRASSNVCDGIYVSYNNLYNGSTSFSCPSNFSNNLSVNPKLTDPANNDYSLQSGSSLIDAGTFLTTTNGSGSRSTTMVVNDAYYFTDGAGVVPGDVIQLKGQTATATITKINYSTNTLTLDTPLTWSNGTGVALAYKGSAPDIGAYEFGSTAAQSQQTSTVQLPAPWGLTLSVTN